MRRISIHCLVQQGFLPSLRILLFAEVAAFIGTQAGIFHNLDTAHCIETYIAYLQATNASDLQNQTNKKVQGIRIACPVDVEVRDSSGNLLGRVKNNEIDGTVSNKVPIAVGGDNMDEKTVIIPDGSGCKINLSGTDTGIMDYTITEYDLFTGEPLLTKEYKNVALTAGKKFTSIVGSVAVPQVQLQVVNNSGAPTANVDTNGTETPITHAITTDGTSGSDTYGVAFDLNGGMGTAPTESAKAVGATFTAPTSTGLTAPEGKQFKEWNTQSDGKGTPYAAGADITMTAAALKLYAIWEDIPAPPTFAVTYDLNGGTGTAPTQADQAQGATFTAPSSTELTAPAGKRFKEWNTESDGTGTAYKAGATVTMPCEALKLYAVWEDIPANDVDKAALEARVAEIGGTQKSNYTGASWDAFQIALKEAQAVADDADATQAQVNDALAALNTAFGNLQPKMIFTTHYESKFWNWVLFIFCFGWAWMWLA